MIIRKIAVLGSFAAGAALAFAPLAAADGGSAAVDPVTSILAGEESSLNSQFEFDALLTGDSGDITQASAANPFDTITPADITTVEGNGTTATPFDDLVYGVDPIKAGISFGDPGSYDVLNGGEIRFDEAYNVLSYALANDGALDPNSADVFGASIPAGDTAAQAFAAFYNDGIGDLSGFFQTSLSSLDITPTEATDLFSLLGSL
jgi:hypothetical protein